MGPASPECAGVAETALLSLVTVLPCLSLLPMVSLLAVSVALNNHIAAGYPITLASTLLLRGVDPMAGRIGWR